METYKIKYAESGNDKISSEIAQVIEEKLNFNLKWILTGEGPMKRGDERPVPPSGTDFPKIADYQLSSLSAALIEIIEILQTEPPETEKLILDLLKGRRAARKLLKD